MSNGMIQCWRMDDKFQTMVFAVFEEQIAQVVYWGARLPDDEDLQEVALSAQIDVTDGMLDIVPELSLCPLSARTFPGQPGLVIRRETGERVDPDLKHRAVAEDGQRIIFISSDPHAGITLRSIIMLDNATHMFTLHSEVNCDQPMFVDWLSAPVLPANQLSDEMIDFSGRWTGEFQVNRVPWQPGVRLRENVTGRTSHEHFPGLIVLERGATNTRGNVHAFHYAWSGGHRMVAEELSDGRRQIQFGNTSGAFREPSKLFASAPLLATFSADGMNGCAIRFQRHLRSRILKPVSPQGTSNPQIRPVHYNCWEAVYFNHDIEQLKSIADKAAEIGAERFVLDDGWFKGRKNDTCALGDWDVDTNKYPEGLGGLIHHVKQRGMGFGIWLEPEMLSVNSDLYREHPDWLLGKIDQIPGRQQYALDMSKVAVKTYLFGKISALLSNHDIEYVKWDHNRVLPLVDVHQTLGTYELLDRLRHAHPSVEFESCSAGGGRIDFGILERTQRVWLSDSNDAVERLRIQHDAALFLPACVTGSHVGPRQCHTSGREIDIRMRAWVAAQRHLGYELDPRELSQREHSVLKTVTQWWKKNRTWMMSADIHRLDCADPNIIAEIQVSDDERQFVVFVGSLATTQQTVPRPLRFTGLDPNATYKLELANRVDLPVLSRGDMAIKKGIITLSGKVLMERGITLPWSFPQTIWVIVGIKSHTAQIGSSLPLSSTIGDTQNVSGSPPTGTAQTAQTAAALETQTTPPAPTPPPVSNPYQPAYSQQAAPPDRTAGMAATLPETTLDDKNINLENQSRDDHTAEALKQAEAEPSSGADLGSGEPGVVSWDRAAW